MDLIEKLNNNNWKDLKQIYEGFDKCEKYSFYINNDKYILKIFNVDQYDKKRREYDILCKLSKRGLNIPHPIEFGNVDDDNYYYILSWVEGNTISNLYDVNDNKMFYIGRQVGTTMINIHKNYRYDLNLSENVDIILKKLQIYKDNNFNLKNDLVVMEYVKKNIYKLLEQPISIIHGDLNETNIVLKDNKIGLIDFGSTNINFSYYDLHQVQMYNRFFNIPFSVGVIDSYSEEIVDKKTFWECLKIYSAYLSLYKIVWAKKQKNSALLNQMIQRYFQTYNDYCGFSIDIPQWYQDYNSKILTKKIV